MPTEPIVLMPDCRRPSTASVRTILPCREKKRELSKITRNAKSISIIAHILIVSEARR
jgi:hypothetical protein